MDEIKTSGKKHGNNYNLTAEFDNRIAPIVKQLKEECLKNGVPLFLSCAIADNGSTTTYRHEAVSAATVHRRLSFDIIDKELCVVRGFDVIPHGVDPFEDDDMESSEAAYALAEKLNSD